MEMPFPHEAKKLQAGLDDHKSHAASNDAEGDIKKPEENNIFYVPEPFKTKRSHLFSPYSATAFNSLSFGNTGRYLYAAENSSTPYPITAKATPHSCHVGR
jgi:hypothetical protein